LHSDFLELTCVTGLVVRDIWTDHSTFKGFGITNTATAVLYFQDTL